MPDSLDPAQLMAMYDSDEEDSTPAPAPSTAAVDQAKDEAKSDPAQLASTYDSDKEDDQETQKNKAEESSVKQEDKNDAQSPQAQNQDSAAQGGSPESESAKANTSSGGASVRKIESSDEEDDGAPVLANSSGQTGSGSAQPNGDINDDAQEASVAENNSDAEAGARQPTSSSSATADAGPSSSDQSMVVEPKRLLELVKKLADHKKSTWFRKPVDRAMLPTYHDVISHPMDLSTLKSKINQGAYRTLGEFEKDLYLIFTNARTFNAPASEVFVCASDLQKYYEDKAKKLTQPAVAKPKTPRVSSGPKSLTGDGREACQQLRNEGDTAELWEQCKSALEKISSKSNSRWFLSPVDPVLHHCHDYFNVIKQPMDLGTVASKLENEEYDQGLSQFVADVRLVWKNATTYNSPGTQVYVDAQELARQFEGLVKKSFPAECLRAAGITVQQITRTSGTAPLPVPAVVTSFGAPSVGRGEGSSVAPDSEQRMTSILFKHCSSAVESLYSSNDGLSFRQPVDPVALGIPSYFEKIKKPMDLGTIKNKLKGKKYSTLGQLVDDAHLTFDNAVTFNGEAHPVAIAAKELKAKFNKRIARIVDSQNKYQDMHDAGIDDDPPSTAGSKRGRAAPTESLKKASGLAKTSPKQYQFAKKLVTEMGGVHGMGIYVADVDPVLDGVPDYFDYVDNPMSLNSMEKKLNGMEYTTADEVYADFMLIAENCKVYHKAKNNTYFTDLAAQFIKSVKQRWKNLPKAPGSAAPKTPSSAGVGSVKKAKRPRVEDSEESEEEDVGASTEDSGSPAVKRSWGRPPTSRPRSKPQPAPKPLPMPATTDSDGLKTQLLQHFMSQGYGFDQAAAMVAQTMGGGGAPMVSASPRVQKEPRKAKSSNTKKTPASKPSKPQKPQKPKTPSQPAAPVIPEYTAEASEKIVNAFAELDEDKVEVISALISRLQPEVIGDDDEVEVNLLSNPTLYEIEKQLKQWGAM